MDDATQHRYAGDLVELRAGDRWITFVEPVVSSGAWRAIAGGMFVGGPLCGWRLPVPAGKTLVVNLSGIAYTYEPHGFTRKGLVRLVHVEGG